MTEKSTLIGDYARAQAKARLRKLAEEVKRASAAPDPDAIHDLRVSIRRFGQCLRAFGQFFPPKKRKRVRTRMRKVMDVAAEIRDRDIALELLARAGVAEDSEVARAMAAQRSEAERELVRAVRRWQEKEIGRAHV